MTLEPHIPPHAREELRALAAASGVSYEELVLANAVVDSACTAFVASGAATRDGSLLVGRNMDFWPTHVLGPATALIMVQAPGRRTFVSVGWPGVTGVVSGMNETGLVAAILINYAAGERRSALPLAFALREALETCGSVEEARALLRARRPASAHFVLLADAHAGLVLTSDGQEAGPAGGTLTCSNGRLHPLLDLQTDERSAALAQLLEDARGRLDPPLAQRVLGATYLPFINAQAMVFVPARRELYLARGSTLRPAACQEWLKVDLSAALAAGSFDPVRPQPATPPEGPLPHFRDHDYPRQALLDRVTARTRAAAQRIASDASLGPGQRGAALARLARALEAALPDPDERAPLEAELERSRLDAD